MMNAEVAIIAANRVYEPCIIRSPRCGCSGPRPAAGRSGTPDEMATIAALLVQPDGAFIIGSDFPIDGGSLAA